MSRLRIGHGPDDWTELGPETPHHFAQRYASIPVSTVGSFVQPKVTLRVASPGEVLQIARRRQRRDDWRKTQEAEASQRYRDRKRA